MCVYIPPVPNEHFGDKFLWTKQEVFIRHLHERVGYCVGAQVSPCFFHDMFFQAGFQLTLSMA